MTDHTEASDLKCREGKWKRLQVCLSGSMRGASAYELDQRPISWSE